MGDRKFENPQSVNLQRILLASNEIEELLHEKVQGLLQPEADNLGVSLPLN